MSERRDQLKRLLERLPEVGSSQDPEVQIRAALRPLIEAAIAQDGRAEPVPTPPGSCPNCGARSGSTRTPYCSPGCKATAAFVRQFREALANGSLTEPERQAGTGQALWALQGGGYPRRQAMVPAKTVAQVIERHGGRCAVCGKPATGVDHTGSG